MIHETGRKAIYCAGLKIMIEIKNLTKKFGDSTILDNVNAEINEGDVIAIIGPSGTGKSTFIRCLNRLISPTQGQVIFDGEDITAADADVHNLRRRMGMVFQQFNLFDHLTVVENVMIPQMDILGRSREEAYEKAQDYLRMVGMSDRMLNYPESLSGGQKQRAAIARTLAMDPEIILLDEPTSALDPTLVGEVEYIIEQLAKQGRTMIIVTHEMRLAKRVANRVFYMDDKGIYEQGTADQIFNHPQKEKTKRFIQQTKTIEFNIANGTGDMPEMISKVAVYGDMLAVSTECMNRMQMALEEACIQVIYPQLKPGNQIHVQLESTYESENIKIVISYDGEKIDCLKAIDPISQKMLNYASESIEEEGNTLKLSIKK